MTEQTEQLAKHGEYKIHIDKNMWTDEKLLEHYITDDTDITDPHYKQYDRHSVQVQDITLLP